MGPSLITKMCEFLPDILHSRVTRICLWLISEYSETLSLQRLAIDTIYDALSPLPFSKSKFIIFKNQLKCYRGYE